MTGNDRSLLIIYPWGVDSVIEKNIGAGLRVGLLADFLQENGFRITVASVGRTEREFERNGIHFREFRFPSTFVLLTLYAALILFTRCLGWQGLHAWIYYTFFQYDRRFARLMKEEMAKAGIILLEYPFWAKLIHDFKIRTILTDHDIIAESWTKCGCRWLNNFLYKILLNKELSSFESAGRVVFVAESDRKFFVDQGLKSEHTAVITNPIKVSFDTIKCSCAPQLNYSFRGFEFHIGALFVGSGWFPNREAAQAIATTIALDCPYVTFFIAGECSTWVKNAPSNVRLLGVLSAEELSILYRMITFALIPVTWGTGSSLKTVEAMAYGKVIITTPVGVRGLAFEHGVHGMLCDEISEFPRQISQLTRNSTQRNQLESGARSLAKKYDYRTIFMRYLEIIDELSIKS
ncbi:glycosyltransferase [Pelobacter propionicus]|uniref:Glycosyl transferase, group 1 n=1 Tax=Pelobacter propionicus (strain DSM 2379 / NBRC 103807 / OttBd1) TaxID=338966 RepID=A1AQU1_PELPD|nr:glycosyltransferase [Pelobacter propionicus]ABK99711.1 glycosyl transferase, group 1 [Pelobacter propionicus DSM 2379]